MQSDQFDVLIIGSGQGGGPLASAFATAGRKTALIEREYPGGTCVNWGCTPTKTMIASGRIAHLARRAADYGVHTGDISVDMKTVRQRKRDIVESFRAGSRTGIEQTKGLEYIEGDAHFSGDRTVSVTLNADASQRELHAETIVINAGERSRPLDIENAHNVPIHDNRSIMELDHVPEHLIVVGAGPIALEFSQLFRRLGAEVTILNRGPQILSNEDPDIAKAVAEILFEDGLRILTDTSPIRLTKDGDDIVLRVSGKGQVERDLRGSHLLAAAGRIPNSDTLHLDDAGIQTNDKGYIPTNSRLETNISGIYAIGDIRPGPKFTHISYDDYRILKTNLIDGGNTTIDNRLVPATTYIDPQLGRIGPTEQDVKDSGVPYLIASMPMERVARARETDETRGLMKVLVHAETERILGAAILGIEGGEIASMLQIAMMGDLPYTALRDGVFAHPTLAESLNNLFGKLRSPDD